MNDSVASDALVMPSSTDWYAAGRSSRDSARSFSALMRTRSTCSPRR
jgi:hypothetical protein